jgi:hypothetical protein
MRCDAAKDPFDSPLVHGADLIHKGIGDFSEAAPAGLEPGVEGALRRSTTQRNHAKERKTLIGRDLRIADDHAGSCSALLMTARGIEPHQNDRPSVELHLPLSTQPRPGTQRTAAPVRGSTKPALSRRFEPHSASPASATSLVSG